MKPKALLLILLTTLTTGAVAKDYTVTSPNGQLVITIHADQQRLRWEVQHGATEVLTPSEIGLNGSFQKMNGKVTKNTAVISNRQYCVEFRADNDAAAYRIHVLDKNAVTIQNETAEFNFADDYNAFIPYVNDNRGGERYCFSFESQGKLAVIADMGAIDYPGMFLVKNGTYGLKAVFAPYPTAEEIGGFSRLNLVPTARASYIAKDVKGALPWRIVLVTEQDKQLLAANLPQRYGPQCQLTDNSWIRPGKVAWDWWNATMLTGVPFRSGMNTDTYRYYIDFAAKNHLEYIIID